VKKVRSLIDNQLIGTVVCARGQVAECADDRAKILVARGLAEYADGEAPGHVVNVPGRAADATETAVRKGPPAESAARKG
jgi:hypothetical protein